ncbi:MAG: sialidase family protein, partial [Niameybacter sp.]
NKMQDLVYAYSDDDGKTWSEEISLKKFYDDACNLFLQGPGNGIQLENGTLVIPIQRWVPPHTNIRSTAGIIYSTDHGATWHQSETRIETYSSESSIVEYKPNEILISCRTPLTDARGFYTTSDLGTTWTPHTSNNTLYELGGCQSPLLKFTAPNQKEYCVYATPQHTGISWQRSKLTLMVTDDYIHWNTIAEVLHTSNDGYSCFTYDNQAQALYLLTEQKGDIVCHNLSCYLPAIMQNTASYDHQAISKVHRFPTYSMGHYLNITHKDEWYKLLTLKLKPNSFALLNLHILGFEHNNAVTLRAKQQDDAHHNLDLVELTSDLPLTLVPTLKEDDYFVYEVYYQATTPDTLSLSVQNCMLSDFDGARLTIATTFQDGTLETSIKTLPTTN